MNSKKRMRELIELMKAESKAYYQDSKPIVTDAEYDRQFNELQDLEKATGLIFADSPTQIVSGGVSDKLKKVQHIQPMLSCDKSQDKEFLAQKFGTKATVVSYKMDGLTIVIRYEKGHLQQIVTRGDGLVGENITHNASALDIPLVIPYDGYLEVRGEGVISWKDFEEFNEDEEYSHPRNLASGSVRQQDPYEAAKRKVKFFAFDLITPYRDNKIEQFKFLSNLGFRVVEHKLAYSHDEILTIMDFFREDYEYPVDGIILEYNDVIYGKSLGATSHHENCRMAYKWEDPKFKTIFRGVDVATTRTGRVSLTAMFDPVIIEGSKVQRATLHNLSFFRNLHLGIGDEIKVYKAHKIIPAIYKNNTKSGTYRLPKECPCCGTKLVEADDQLQCTNPDCSARKQKQFENFVSKRSLNIDGLGGSTMEMLLNNGFVKTYADIFRLEKHKDEIAKLPGWAYASVSKMLDSIESARHTSLAALIPAFGIPMVGKTAGKQIHKHFHGDVNTFTQAVTSNYDFTQLNDFGEIMDSNLHCFFKNEENINSWNDLLTEITWSVDEQGQGSNQVDLPLTGKTVVATGKMPLSRDEINNLIESLGAKAGSSVSKKTDLVVVGENAGSKKDKAESLGVPVIPISEFLEKYKKE